MDISDWQKNWNELGKDDPLWVVLTDPAKKGGKWDPSEFFETGRTEIKNMLRELSDKGIELDKTRALDFGCGVGRLSQALSEHFDRVDGVDLAPSMVEHARRFNRHPEKCHYHVTGAVDLSLFNDSSFNFLYSALTLQHIEVRFQKVYLQEFVRVLAPGGIACFQIISATLRRALYPASAVNFIRRREVRGRAFMGMFGIPRRQTDDILGNSGATILFCTSKPLGWRWIVHRYVVRK